MKKLLKKSLAVFMVVVSILTAAPLSSLEISMSNFGKLLDNIFKGLSIVSSAQSNGLYTYNITKSNTVTITDCDENVTGNLIIPSHIDGYPVTVIGNSAFEKCTNITEVVIPDTVVTISGDAFYECTDLKNVILSTNLESIGAYAFLKSGLESVTIPESVKSIGERAFSMTNIETVYFNAIDCSYWRYFSSGISSLFDSAVNVYIGSKVQTIPEYFLKDNSNVSSILIPENVTTIKSGAFWNCSNLNSVTIPKNVETLGDYVFCGCVSLKSVDIKGGISIIDTYAFGRCSSLNSVNIAYGPTKIAFGAFYECQSIEEITIPDSVEEIGDEAFRKCINLVAVEIPKSVTRINSYAFKDCESLKYMHISETVSTIDGSILPKTAYICSNVEYSYAKEYAEANGYTFKVCDGSHANGSTPVEPETPTELKLVSTYPANGATQLSYEDDMVLTFNMNVERDLHTLQDDGIAVGIYDYNTDELVKSFDGLYVGYKNEGNKMIFEDAFRKLEPGKKYYVKIASDAVYSKTDGKTLFFNGIANKDEWTFSYLSPTEKKGYSLDVYSSHRALNISQGESAKVNIVLSYNGEPCGQDGILISVANNSIVTIDNIKRENDRTVVTLTGVKNGTTTVTVTDNGSKSVQIFPVFVTDESSVYYFTDVEKYTEYNPFILDDMYVDNFSHKEKSNGSHAVTFDIYNMGHSYGAVDVYDKNGNVVDSQIIEMFDGDYPTDLFTHAEYAGKLVGNFALDIITGDFLYSINNIKSDLNSKKTSVSITVPENGYYVITKNVTASNSCLLYNAFSLALDVAFESVDLIVDATDVADELAQSVLSKNVDKYLKKICETLVEEGAMLTAKNASIMSETLLDDVEDLFKALGTTFIDAVIETVPRVTAKITKTELIEIFAGLSLKKCGKDIVDNILYSSVKCAKWVAICKNVYDYRNSTNAYIYDLQSGNTKTSNGIISYSNTDSQTVFHSILVTSGYYADYIDAIHRPEAEAELYSISMVKNGKKVQPDSPVTVYIPVPDGWDNKEIYIYHINDKYEREELEGTVENGYIKFVTNGFSYFVISNDVINFIDSISIKSPSTTTINYGDTLVLHADLGGTDLPEGYSILWTVEGSGVSIKPSDDGLTCEVTSVQNGNVTVKATVVDENGEAILDADGNEISASQQLNSKVNFWQKIVSFFKNLFRISRIILQYK